MYANTEMQLAHADNVTTIPVEALVLKGNQQTVYCWTQIIAFASATCEVGLRGSKLAEIKSGLEPGDRVVLGGQENYTEGERVAPILTSGACFGCCARVRRCDRSESGQKKNNGGAK